MQRPQSLILKATQLPEVPLASSSPLQSQLKAQLGFSAAQPHQHLLLSLIIFGMSPPFQDLSDVAQGTPLYLL